MPLEYRYVKLPPLDTKPARGESLEDYITRLLMEYVDDGWDVVSTDRFTGIGPVHFTLRRGSR